jgi:hypothetical protein
MRNARRFLCRSRQACLRSWVIGGSDYHTRRRIRGEIIWDYDTNKSFDTVSGEVAHGGSIDADGSVVIGGHVLLVIAQEGRGLRTNPRGS